MLGYSGTALVNDNAFSSCPDLAVDSGADVLLSLLDNTGTGGGWSASGQAALLAGNHMGGATSVGLGIEGDGGLVVANSIIDSDVGIEITGDANLVIRDEVQGITGDCMRGYGEGDAFAMSSAIRCGTGLSLEASSSDNTWSHNRWPGATLTVDDLGSSNTDLGYNAP